MKRHHRATLVAVLSLGLALLAPASAEAVSSYYAADCQSCHDASPTSCNGCHRHRGTVTGSLPKTTFQPGESIAVTVGAGARNGWWRGAVLDAQNNVVGTATATASGNVTVTVSAPPSAGTYGWKAAWYGHQYTETPAAGAWVPDSGNASHGYLTTALPAFTVEAPAPAPAPSARLSPTAVDLGAVTTGKSASKTATVTNSGTSTLSVTAVAACDSSGSAFITVSPSAGFTVAAGGSAPLTVTFAPSSTGAAQACWNLATNDPAHPTLQLTASGTGQAPTPPPADPSPFASLAPPAVDLGTVTVSQASTRSATLSNTGNADLVVSAVTACDSAGAASLSISPNTGFTVAAGGSATVTVAFAPTAAGAARACWNLATNDSAHPSLQLTASGTGQPQQTPSCTTCHGVPPASGEHAAHAREGCGACHGAGYSSTTFAAGTHQNGTVDLASSAGWKGGATSCANACHGSRAWGTGGGSSGGSSSSGGASSSGGSSSGGSSSSGGATASCTSCHAIPPTTGKHTLHRSEHVSCASCHGSGYSTTTVSAKTHRNGTKDLTAAVNWSASARSCSNSCHGKESWGGSGGATTGCTSCHGIPPNSGEHALHQSKRIGCGSCHGSGYSGSAVSSKTHRDGKVTLSKRVGFNAGRRTCSNSCHGRESWVASRGGGDDYEEDDFVILDDTDAGTSEPAPRSGGGCSSAGGALPLLGLVGVALGGLRRRRR